MTWLIVPTRWISSSSGSFVDGSIWEERKIRRSKERAPRGRHGFVPPDEQGDHHAGEYDDVRRGRAGGSSCGLPWTPLPIGSGELRLLPFHDLGLDAPSPRTTSSVTMHLLDVALGRDLVHHVEHDVLEDERRPRAPAFRSIACSKRRAAPRR